MENFRQKLFFLKTLFVFLILFRYVLVTLATYSPVSALFILSLVTCCSDFIPLTYTGLVTVTLFSVHEIS